MPMSARRPTARSRHAGHDAAERAKRIGPGHKAQRADILPAGIIVLDDGARYPRPATAPSRRPPTCCSAFCCSSATTRAGQRSPGEYGSESSQGISLMTDHADPRAHRELIAEEHRLFGAGRPDGKLTDERPRAPRHDLGARSDQFGISYVSAARARNAWAGSRSRPPYATGQIVWNTTSGVLYLR